MFRLRGQGKVVLEDKNKENIPITSMSDAVLQLEYFSRAHRPVALFQRPVVPFFMQFATCPLFW